MDDTHQNDVMEDIVRKWFLERFHAPHGIMMYTVLLEMSNTMGGKQISECLPYIFSGGIVVQAEKKRKCEEETTEETTETHKRMDAKCCADMSGNQEAHYGCCTARPDDEEEVSEETLDMHVGPAGPPSTSLSPSSPVE